LLLVEEELGCCCLWGSIANASVYPVFTRDEVGVERKEVVCGGYCATKRGKLESKLWRTDGFYKSELRIGWNDLLKVRGSAGIVSVCDGERSSATRTLVKVDRLRSGRYRRGAKRERRASRETSI
jgi:hypothetical protein